MYKNDPHIGHHRRSVRLKGYDYSQNGAYFVTICTQDKRCLFGNVVQGVFVSNPAGKMIRQVWDEAPDYYPIKHGEFVVMPNHIHAIIILSNTTPNTPESVGLGDVVHRYKTMTTHRYAMGLKQAIGRHFLNGYGNAIIMNILSETKMNTALYRIIL